MQTLPEVLEVSSRSAGPAIEVASAEQFIALVSETHPKHVFHWWNFVKVDEKWRRNGEFFFVLDGTYYRLDGYGYRALADLIDGRSRGLKGAEDFRSTPGPYGNRLSCWKDIISFNGLDYNTQRPSEADVYYYLRDKGLPTFEALKESEGIDPRSRDSIEC